MPEARKGDTTDTRAPGGPSGAQNTGGGNHGNGPDTNDRQQHDFGRAVDMRAAQDAMRNAEQQAAADDAARQQRDIDRANDTRAAQDAMNRAERQANNTADNPSDANNNGGNTQSAGADPGGQDPSGPSGRGGENRSSDGPTQSAAAQNTGGGTQGSANNVGQKAGSANQGPSGLQGESRSSDGPTQSAAASPPGEQRDSDGGGSIWPSSPPTQGPEEVVQTRADAPKSDSSDGERPIEIDLGAQLLEYYTPEEIAERSDASTGEEGEGRGVTGRILWGSDVPMDPELGNMSPAERSELAESQRYIPSTAIGASSLLVADGAKALAELLTKNWLMEKAIQATVGTLYGRAVTPFAFEVTNSFHEHVLDQPIVDPNPGLLSERMLGDILPGFASTAAGMMAANAAKIAASTLLAGTALAPIVVPLAAIGAGVVASSKTYTHFDQAWQNYTYDPTDPADLQRFLDNLTPEQRQDYEDNQDLLGLMADDFVRQSIADMNMEDLLENGPTLAELTSPLSEPVTSEDAIRDITNYLNDIEDGDAVVVAEAPAQPEVPDILGADHFDFPDEMPAPTYTPAAEDIAVIDGEIVDLSIMQPVDPEPVKIVDVRPDLDPPSSGDMLDDVVVVRANPRGEQRNSDGEDRGDGVPWRLHISMDEIRNGSDGDYGGYSNWDGA